MHELTGRLTCDCLHYFRLGRKYLVATEVNIGLWQADILASNWRKIVETEIKISLSDLKNDIKKRYKMSYYQKDSKHMSPISNRLPNEFYYCMPEELVDKAIDFITNYRLRAGLLRYRLIDKQPHCRNIKCVKRAPKLHNGFAKELHESIIRRATTDLCNLYERIYYQKVGTD